MLTPLCQEKSYFAFYHILCNHCKLWIIEKVPNLHITSIAISGWFWIHISNCLTLPTTTPLYQEIYQSFLSLYYLFHSTILQTNISIFNNSKISPLYLCSRPLCEFSAIFVPNDSIINILFAKRLNFLVLQLFKQQ